MIVIPENLNAFLFVVNKYISYLLFRVYSTEEINAATTMAAARMERAETGQQFVIPRPRENSWGHKRVLEQEKIIREFVGYTPVMNERKEPECMESL